MNLALKFDERIPVSVTAERSDGFRMHTVLASSDFSFDILDDEGSTVLMSRPFSRSPLRTFLGHGEHQIIHDGSVVANVCYRGLFGFTRVAKIGDQAIPFPHANAFTLMQRTWDYAGHTLSIRNIQHELMCPIIGLGFYWIVRIANSRHSS